MLTHYWLIQGSVWEGQRGELPAAEPGQHAEGRLQGRAVRRQLLQKTSEKINW
jgi:hypothetical protein